MINVCSNSAKQGFSEAYVPTRLDGRGREHRRRLTTAVEPFAARVMYDAHNIPHGYTPANGSLSTVGNAVG